MDNSLGFRGAQVCKLADITYRQLDYWAKTGLLCPSLTEAHGSGSQRSYSYKDILELKVVKHLLVGGLSLQAARKAVEYLKLNLKEDLSNANLLIVGPGTVLVRNGDEIVDLLKRGQLVMSIIVSLHEIANQLRAEVIAMTPASETTQSSLEEAGDTVPTSTSSPSVESIGLKPSGTAL